ncbi:uncharacterized protein SPSK_07003 [Sporothrix schenckii 1099-18]|uniref:Zn(2)-C6 fungal-type domain-containing protein n=1 Tax=Sporothrix schenckii 1099-18 TaxID=1397361 RepID=A0A0F2MED2_SPOSC|nr:uncharacterized protein SPSK_07003 [Sporothrix schenckii 1099-18]KJR88038.1 hypothetical protein SPSK_07003 [Sporothrix schenckii 1099-18]
METPTTAAAAATAAGTAVVPAAVSTTAPATAPATEAPDTTTTTTTTSAADLSSKKVSQTCVTCRARKVRCDGRRDICSNCERLGFPCSFDDTAVVVNADAKGQHGGADGALSADANNNSARVASTTATASDPLLAIPRRRARQACQNCHSRKARCSGGTPQCDRCRTLGIECVYRPGKRTRMSPVLSGSISGDRDRDNNRDSRGEPPSQQHGFERGLSESSDHMDDVPMGGAGPGGHAGHAGGLGRHGGPSSASTGGAGVDTTLLSTRSCPSDVLEALAMRTFDQFFRHIHHIPTFAFLHRASLMQRYRAGLVDRPLLLALVGITSLMTDLGPGTRELGKQCIAEAEALVLSRLDRPSTLGLQTLVFVIHHRVLSGRFSSAFMLHGVASRFASALRLNHENPRLCFLARESRRRLMWALYMIDSSMANGYADFSLWAYRADDRADVMNIQLPCNERNFEFDLPERTEPLRPPPRLADGSLPPLPDDIGFLALHVRIRSIRGRILQYTKDVTSNLSTPPPSSPSTAIDENVTAFNVASIPGRVAEIAAELDDFAARLPVSFRWSEGNVRLRTYSPRLCVFLMTHVWWEQCHCELYRLALVGLQEALPAPCIAQLEHQFPTWVRHCREQVLEHASAMADMFRLVLTLENGVPATDLDLPICLYQCVRLLFYISRTNPDDPQAVPHDSFLELAGVCTQVLERTVTTPATIRIRANLQKLMTQGLSTANIAPSGRSTPEVLHMETEDDISTMMRQPGRNGNGNSNGVASATIAAAAAATATAAPSPLLPGLSQRAAASAGPPPYAQTQQQPQQPQPPQQLAQHPHQLQQPVSLPGLSNAPPVMFDAFDNHMAAAAAAAAAAGPTGVPGAPTSASTAGAAGGMGLTGLPTTSGAAPTPAGVSGVSSTSSPQPSLASHQPGAALDAFDLDVDNFGSTDLGGWFSGDWVTNNEFST